jgi:uncharacterized RDD family membrane protein YckC
MWVGLKVTDVKGDVISKGRALTRSLLLFLSFITCGIGFFIQPFTLKKQTLHDTLSGTIIVNTIESGKRKSVFIFDAFVYSFAAMIALFLWATV